MFISFDCVVVINFAWDDLKTRVRATHSPHTLPTFTVHYPPSYSLSLKHTHAFYFPIPFTRTVAHNHTHSTHGMTINSHILVQPSHTLSHFPLSNSLSLSLSLSHTHTHTHFLKRSHATFVETKCSFLPQVSCCHRRRRRRGRRCRHLLSKSLFCVIEFSLFTSKAPLSCDDVPRKS